MKSLQKYQTPLPAVPEKIWQDPLYFFAFGLGSGAMPFAPGTFGTLMAIPCYLLIQDWPLAYYLSFVILFIALSSLACEKVSRDIQLHDHQGMCIDEFAGFFVTMIAAPIGLIWVLLGFVFFRFFDIVKPWPIDWIDQKVHGGFGMILDDVVAGIYSCLLIQLISYFFR